MKTNIILDDKYYSDAPPEVDKAFERSVEIRADFLPPPEDIKKAGIKKTISIRLDKENIDYFKQAAAKNGTHYQTLINDLLRVYVNQHRAS
jgi:uncharacterized protein (DUF4415 family)